MKYIAYVNGSNASGIDYEKRTNPFSKIKVDSANVEKQITTIRWTNNNYFIAGAISDEETKRGNKIYSI